jgi:hypothetical protein
MSAGLPNPETPYQLEGRAAHALAEYAFTHPDLWTQVIDIDIETEEGTKGFPVDDTMREAVALFVATVKAAQERLGQDGFDARLFIERSFDLGILRPPEAMFGTADAVIVATRQYPALNDASRIIEVFDLKYGAGVVVEVQDNEQLFYYVLGAILAEFTRCVMDPNSPVLVEDGETILEAATKMFDEVRVTIVQPRAPHTDGAVRTSLTFSGGDVRVFAEKLLDRARATQAANAPLTAGEWCQFCPARGHCPELAARSKLVAMTDFESVPVEAPPAVEHLPIERVAAMLTQVEVLNIFIAALKERVTRELEAGREVPGWKLVNKRAQRQWNNAEDVEMFASTLGFDPYVRELMSPAQMEKIIGKAGLPEELYSRVSSGLTLVASSDARPAAAVGPAEDFAQLPKPETENNG